MTGPRPPGARRFQDQPANNTARPAGRGSRSSTSRGLADLSQVDRPNSPSSSGTRVRRSQTRGRSRCRRANFIHDSPPSGPNPRGIFPFKGRASSEEFPDRGRNLVWPDLPEMPPRIPARRARHRAKHVFFDSGPQRPTRERPGPPTRVPWRRRTKPRRRTADETRHPFQGPRGVEKTARGSFHKQHRRSRRGRGPFRPFFPAPQRRAKQHAGPGRAVALFGTTTTETVVISGTTPDRPPRTGPGLAPQFRARAKRNRPPPAGKLQRSGRNRPLGPGTFFSNGRPAGPPGPETLPAFPASRGTSVPSRGRAAGLRRSGSSVQAGNLRGPLEPGPSGGTAEGAAYALRGPWSQAQGPGGARPAGPRSLPQGNILRRPRGFPRGTAALRSGAFRSKSRVPPLETPGLWGPAAGGHTAPKGCGKAETTGPGPSCGFPLGPVRPNGGPIEEFWTSRGIQTTPFLVLGPLPFQYLKPKKRLENGPEKKAIRR